MAKFKFLNICLVILLNPFSLIELMYLYLFGSYHWLQKSLLPISSLVSTIFVYNYHITIKSTEYLSVQLRFCVLYHKLAIPVK